MSVEHLSLHSRDWRLYATCLATECRPGWSWQAWPAGTPIEVVGFAKYDRDLLAFPAPFPVALYLSLARNTQRTGARLLEKCLASGLEAQPQGFTRVPAAVETQLFDGLENVLAAVVFSHTAIEAFANWTIPEDWEYVQDRQDGRRRKVYSSGQIERHLSLEVKLDQILPKVHSVPSPKGTAIWGDYVWLRRLRNRLVHLKSPDIGPSNPEQADKLVWTALLEPKVHTAPEVAMQLIEHYLPADRPRWAREFWSRLSGE